MAYKVKFTLPEREIGKADIEGNVFTDEKKLGTLKISKGAIEWVPRDASNGFSLHWCEFAKIMETNGNK